MRLIRLLLTGPQPAPDLRTPRQRSADQARAAFAVLTASCVHTGPAAAELLALQIMNGSSDTWQVAGPEGLVYGMQNVAMRLLVAYANAAGLSPEEALRTVALQYETQATAAGA